MHLDCLFGCPVFYLSFSAKVLEKRNKDLLEEKNDLKLHLAQTISYCRKQEEQLRGARQRAEGESTSSFLVILWAAC